MSVVMQYWLELIDSAAVTVIYRSSQTKIKIRTEEGIMKSHPY